MKERHAARPGYRASKRTFDVVAAAFGLLLLSPICVAIYLAILLDDGPPAIYRGRRVGRDCREFDILKFRSMVRREAAGEALTTLGDPRITRVGRVLRRSKLDEIPQLVNVLCGEMSLVGPRPEDPSFVAGYTDEERRLLTVRPGITSVASLRYRNEEEHLTGDDPQARYREVILPDKLRLELEYLDKCGFWTDLRVVGATLLRLAK